MADLVAGGIAHQAVGRRDRTAGAGDAVAPRGRPGVYPPPQVPVGAEDHIVAVAQRRHAREGDKVFSMAAHQAVGRRDRAGNAGRAAAPGCRSGVHHPAIVPPRATDHIVAVAQRRDAMRADLVAGGGAHQAVGCRHRAGDAGRAARPRHRPGVCGAAVAPVGAEHQVAAVAQRRHVRADLVAGGAAHQAVGRRHRAAEAGRSVYPRRRPGVDNAAVVPVGAEDHIVAVSHDHHAVIADIVLGRTAGQGADQRPRGAVVQVHRPHVGRRPGVIVAIGHHDVAVGQHRHRFAKHPAAGWAGDVPLRRGGRRPGGPQGQA